MSKPVEMKKLRNGSAIDFAAAPLLGIEQFRAELIARYQAGQRLVALFGLPDPSSLIPDRSSSVRLIAVQADDSAGTLSVAATDVGDRYPSLTPACPQAHWFEREIAEQWGVVPEGHPGLKPVRFHHSYRPSHDAWGRGPSDPIPPAVAEMYRLEGDEVHEVAVGPVHAGVIEPGHFRFQCHGETVFNLEILLGYQHRGVEAAGSLIGGPDMRSIHLMETLAGDTTIAHTTAYCQAIESLLGCTVPARAQVLRGIALELERLANHTGDLGALAGDVGYLPTASFCGRLRGDWLNMTAMLCGNRFGRGLVRPGGVGSGFDLDEALTKTLAERLEITFRDVTGAVELLWNTASVMARFEETGTVSRDDCLALGLVGPAARACGVDIDVRRDHPAGVFRYAQIPMATWHSGDVFARAWVRWGEIQESVRFIREQLAALPQGPIRDADAPAEAAIKLPASKLCVSLVEGWRGEVCHVAITDAAGRFARYKVVDPSFHNWQGLAMSLRGQQISDFPLCNKSFNLSYCGHDL